MGIGAEGKGSMGFGLRPSLVAAAGNTSRKSRNTPSAAATIVARMSRPDFSLLYTGLGFIRVKTRRFGASLQV